MKKIFISLIMILLIARPISAEVLDSGNSNNIIEPGNDYITASFKMDISYGVSGHSRDTVLNFVFSGDKQSVYNTKTGKLLFPFDAGYIFRYHTTDGFTFTGENGEGLWALFDNDGNVILDFEYESIGHTLIPEIVSLRKAGEESKLYHLTRKEYIPAVQGKIVENGLIICTEYGRRQIVGAPVVGDKYTESYPISSRIVNFAGHDVMGKEYKYVDYSDSAFWEDTDGDEKVDTRLEVNQDFAIIRMNDKYLPFDGVTMSQRTLVPVREITEEFGGEVIWDGEDKTATLKIDGNEIVITVENDKMSVNGESVYLDVPVKVINSKVMIPVRKLAEMLNADVDWDQATKCVHISR